KPLEDLRLSLALTKKYGEIFIVEDSFVGSASWIDVGSLEAVCYPLSDKNLTFKASYSIKNQKLNGDKYVEAIVREEAYEEMEQILSQYYTDFLLEVSVFSPMFQNGERANYTDFTNIEDVSITSYEEKYGEKTDISFYIYFNESEIEKYDEVCEIFRSYSERFNNAEVLFWCYYTNSDTISELRTKNKNDAWNNCKLRFATKRSEVPEYVYCYDNGDLYLYWISDADGLRRYDTNGMLITEDEE
ncbi:MAG: hypothetical protein ACI4J4_10210, partial [Ruminiclostridium sp.]